MLQLQVALKHLALVCRPSSLMMTDRLFSDVDPPWHLGQVPRCCPAL